VTDEVVRVIETIVMLSLVILTGLFVRKIKLLDQCTTGKLSAFVVDAAFPALVFTAMLRSVDSQTLAESWYLPVLGAGIFLFGGLIGYLVSPLLETGHDAHRGSFAFTTGTPNWLFIPLPIAIALYGEQGERTVLLFNVGALLVFWSVGVWIVRGGKPDRASLRNLALNPGLLATILGVALALAFPWTQTLETLDVTEARGSLAALSIIVQAAAFLGEVTVPLSMIVTGALLADAGTRGAWNRRVITSSAIRLIAVPASLMLVLWLADMAGLQMAPDVRTILVIISAMPVAVTCSVVVEKYGGDVPLVSRAILVSTLASVVTVPTMLWLMRAIGF
jgi:malate permease and related proteins